MPLFFAKTKGLGHRAVTERREGTVGPDLNYYASVSNILMSTLHNIYDLAPLCREGVK